MSFTLKNIKYWDTQATGFTYPEMDATSGYAPIQNRPNSGICVSGGGSISASLIAGYYKALADLHIMQNLRYISGVSGGTWGSAPYVYGGGPNFSGDPVPPIVIDANHLTETKPGTMQDAAANADIADKCIAFLAEGKLTGIPTNRVYEKGVGACFLKPLGIESPATLPGFEQFFSSTPAMVDDIKKRNPDAKYRFMTMADDMPFLIMNATMFVPVDQTGVDPTNYICPFEITPLYSGIKAPQTITNSKQTIGGFFVESFGFNTTLTGANSGAAQATGDYPFELCQPVAASGSALEEMLETSLPQLLGCFPQFNYWNPYNPDQGTVQYDFGDGGCIEDTGIAALLARGVQNIAAFLTEPVFFPGTDPIGCSIFTERVFGYNQIAGLFGMPVIDAGATVANQMVQYITPANTKKQVFDNSAGQFETLLTNLLAARNNSNGMVVNMALTVIPNTLFGITKGYQAQVIWSVIDKAYNWVDNLQGAVNGFMETKENDLQNFPEILVFGQNKGSVIKLTAAQTNLLADFGYWMVMNNAATFTGVLPPK